LPRAFIHEQLGSRASIPPNPTLLRELRQLERRVARSGKDSVNHPVGGLDDHANALFGAMYLTAKAASVEEIKIVKPVIITGSGAWSPPGGWTTSRVPGSIREW
jgi:hypothetical protein